MTGFILAFWLTMTGWLIHREVVPMMVADISPSYQIDLTDEIGSPMVGWVVFRDKKRIGSGTSKINTTEERAFEFRSIFNFDQFHIGVKPLQVQINQIESMYRVTEEGKLQALSAMVIVHQGAALGIRGNVVDDVLDARFFSDNLEHKVGNIDLPQRGSVVNPMHLVNRLRGLHVGQTWKITILDPVRVVMAELLGEGAKHGMSTAPLLAEVKLDILEWGGKEVLCYKIEYSEPGKEVSARTWVRKLDGLVLQQDAQHLGVEMSLKRMPV